MEETSSKSRVEIPLSLAQEQLWLQLQLSASPLIFNYSSIINFSVDLDIKVIEQGVNFLFQRHEALRLTIHERNGQPFQIVQNYAEVEIPVTDLTLESEAVISSTLKNNLMTPFELDKGPLCKFCIIKSAESTLLQGVAHHLILDGIGTQILEQEGKIIIQAFGNGFSHENIFKRFPPLDYTYTDFVLEQRADTDWAESSYFWKKYLDGIIPLNLGKDGARSPSIGLDAERVEFNWPCSLTQSIQSFTKAHGVSPFVVLTSGLAIVLGRLSSGQTDIGLLIAKHGRNVEKLKNMIGHFSNVLPLRINLNTGKDFIGLVSHVKEDLKFISAHQEYPLQLILKDVEAQKGQRINQHLFFPVTLVMKPANNKDATDYLEIDNSKLSQEIIIHVQGGQMGYVKYNPLIHSRQRIHGMLNNWKTLLENALESFPVQNFRELEIINKDAMEELMKFGTGEKVEVPDMDLTLIDLFERQVEKTPDGTALFDDTGKEMTYSVLRSESRDLARNLIAAHVKDEDKFVAILMEQSPLFIKTTLAILMTGRTIAVFSIHSSHVELNQMLADLGSPLLISTENILQRCGFKNYSRSLCLGTSVIIGACVESNGWHQERMRMRTSKNTSDAYCIFTSGTTGMRKGTILKHSCIIHFTAWSIQEKKYTTSDRTLAFNDVSSDSSLSDIWPTLLSGATLCIPPQSLHYDIEGIWEWIVKNKVTIVQFQTALTNKMLANSAVMTLARQSNVRMLTCGGDRLDSSLTSSLPFELYNEYGLTETTVPVTSTIMCRDKGQGHEVFPSVGRPIWNTCVLILDSHLNIVPIGVHGKIYVSGPGVGKYWNRDELNKSKFIKLRKTYCADADTVFDTGDIGYWDHNGNLNVVGRMDSQVKFRSYRIELKEIEKVISSYLGIQNSVVQIENKNQTKGQELIAYCKLTSSKSQSQISFGDLNQFLKNRLPYYSIPSKIYILSPTQDFPLNSNGKIDFEKLNDNKERKAMKLLTSNYVAPSTEEERKIAQIWADVLNIPVDTVGIHDHFFAVGGHSLLIMSFVRRIQQVFPHVKIHAEFIFREPTIKNLAKLIKAATCSSSDNSSSIEEIMKTNNMGEDVIDFEKEICSADFPIHPDLPISTSSHIFLTGATGYLGSCLLSDLLEKRKNSKIYCLVRGKNKNDAKARLTKAMRPFNLHQESLDRVQVIWGDISCENFGLNNSKYQKLANEVELVYHSADYVNLLQSYHLLSPVNIVGIKQILKFASTFTLKTLHYISSLQIYYEYPRYYEKFGSIIHETPIKAQVINPHEYPPYYWQGYSQCKWVAEHMICRAMKRGLPAVIYRPGEITAHSKLDVVNPADLLYMPLKYCLEIGQFPNILNTRFPYGSVDFTSKAIVDISMKKECVGQTFHVFAHEIACQNVVDFITSRPSIVPRPISIVSAEEWEQNFCDHIAQFPEAGEERKNMERYLFFWYQFKKNFSNQTLHKLKVSNCNTKLVLGDLEVFGQTTMDQDILRAITIALS